MLHRTGTNRTTKATSKRGFGLKFLFGRRKAARSTEDNSPSQSKSVAIPGAVNISSSENSSVLEDAPLDRNKKETVQDASRDQAPIDRQDDDRDLLDEVFEGVERMACPNGESNDNVDRDEHLDVLDTVCERFGPDVDNNDTTAQPKFSDEEDMIDTVFKGVEVIACPSHTAN
eukprot:CAMPEP_0113519250 /NCGR_PEP_ID=MMETSP0014_2-20120614/43418_1 /TAXON_ID=2857 /ORGANISM="Nitzschia sp." /LENGTH=172 /DNA_ID=CAMNT_0000416953 /DNA_START=86 /DNA_END=601 /DNA_ORIENTATION=- /assembly_acc=CAM_ASM_000159